MLTTSLSTRSNTIVYTSGVLLIWPCASSPISPTSNRSISAPSPFRRANSSARATLALSAVSPLPSAGVDAILPRKPR